MRNLLWLLVIVLAVLHQDFWLWDNGTILFGFLPIGLAYQAAFSLAAAAVWLFAVKCAWPTDVEQWAEQTEDKATTKTQRPEEGHEANTL